MSDTRCVAFVCITRTSGRNKSGQSPQAFVDPRALPIVEVHGLDWKSEDRCCASYVAKPFQLIERRVYSKSASCALIEHVIALTRQGVDRGTKLELRPDGNRLVDGEAEVAALWRLSVQGHEVLQLPRGFLHYPRYPALVRSGRSQRTHTFCIRDAGCIQDWREPAVGKKQGSNSVEADVQYFIRCTRVLMEFWWEADIW